MNNLRSLRSKTFVVLILFAMVLICTIGLLVSQRFYQIIIGEAERDAFHISNAAADYIDADAVKKYIKTGETDAYYSDIQKYLNSTRSNTDVLYLYVFVPYDDHLEYIWDSEESKTLTPIGEKDEYSSEEDREYALNAFRADYDENILVEVSEEYGHIATAYTPLLDAGNNPVAVVGVDISMPWVLSAIRRFVFFIITVIVAVTLLALAFVYFGVNRLILTPISKLTQAAGAMVDNLSRDETADIDVHTGDELETLANAFMQMDKDLHSYINELAVVTAEKERIGAELNVAQRIQSGMLPSTFPPFPDKTEFELYASMNPAKEVGGDFYDFFMVDEDHIALIMADVSGKGVPAALFMVIAKTLIKNAAQHGLSPAEVLTSVNKRLSEGNDAGYFVTVWLAIIDLRTGEGLAANAGHEHPVMCRNGGDYELVVYKHGLAVAAMDGLQYKEHEFKMNPGDRLFVYTDGVTEATNTDNELFGTERMLDALNANKDSAAEELLRSVKDIIDDFAGDAPQFDDITMLGFEYRSR